MKLLQKLRDLHVKEVEVNFQKEDMISYFEEVLTREIGIDFELEKTDDGDIFTYESFNENGDIICSVEVGLYFFRLESLFCNDKEIKQKIKTLFEKRLDIK